MKRTHFFASLISLVAAALVLASCASYRQNIMFRVPDEEALKKQVDMTEKNYVIQKNDQLSLEVYTNKGERLVDPQEYISQEHPVAGGQEMRQSQIYRVDNDGTVKFPLLGIFKAEGLTLRQVEEVLEKEYAKYYQQPFVVVQYNNKRVVVLGAPGGQVIPLVNENTHLVEILALAKGVSNDAKAYNIRVLRGDHVYIADFSTFEGYTKGNLIVEPGDVIYVEPIRRPFSEGLRDYGPLVSIITSLTTLVVVLGI